MSMLVIFLVMVAGGVVLYARNQPGGLGAVIESVRAAGTSASGRPLDPRRLGEEIQRAVVEQATPLLDGKYANTTVWVYLSTQTYQRFGDSLLTTVGDQVCTRIDKLVAEKKWDSSGPTSVTWDVDTGLVGDEHRIAVLAGDHTSVEPERAGSRNAGQTTKVVKPRASIVMDGRSRDLPSTGTWVIGRGDGCDVVLGSTDPKLSRRHFKLDIQGTKVTLSDTSTNGTKVNGVRAQRVVLKDGDVIDLPDGTSLTFHVPDVVPAGH